MSDLNNDTVVPSIEGDAPNGTQNAKDTIINSEKLQGAQLLDNTTDRPSGASAAADTIKNHPITQSVTNGPVADNIKDQHAKTQAEFSNLAASKTTPLAPAATGQPLTQYHSLFYSLLSWQNPRASAIAYATSVVFIFVTRYFDILRYTFKATYMILFITVLAEAAGKMILSNGLTTQIRPRKYYTISKETINSLIGDVHELLNFFVIEAQRIVFAENLLASTAALFAAFLSYYLIKVMPFWGLALLTDSVLFGAPLIYKTNQELIDTQVENISHMVSKQTEQVKGIASQHIASASESTKLMINDYSSKASEMVRGRSASPSLAKSTQVKKENVPAYKNEDFPVAPKEEFKSTPIADEMSSVKTEEPLIST